jgi:hypothetical protein
MVFNRQSLNYRTVNLPALKIKPRVTDPWTKLGGNVKESLFYISADVHGRIFTIDIVHTVVSR